MCYGSGFKNPKNADFSPFPVGILCILCCGSGPDLMKNTRWSTIQNPMKKTGRAAGGAAAAFFFLADPGSRTPKMRIWSDEKLLVGGKVGKVGGDLCCRSGFKNPKNVLCCGSGPDPMKYSR